MSPNAWRTVVDIVLNGTFLCSREFARRLIPAGRDGSIVNVGASYAWTGGPGFAHSAAAKAGVKNLVETLAVEWAPYGIRVNGLVPGLMPHEDEVAAIAAVPGKYEGQDDRVPAGRVGYPRELAWAATYLCSPYAVVHQRPLARGRRGQLAASPHRAAPVHPDPEQLGRGPFGEGRATPPRPDQPGPTPPAHDHPRSRPDDRPTVHSATDTRPPLTDEERDLVRLEVDGPVAVITNNRPGKHNAMSDEMDRRLWEVLAEVHELPQLRAIVWRGEGKSFSSGRDTGQIGLRVEDISDLEFIERGHRPTQMFLTMPCPIICALKGWVIGGAFERALLCDIRVAAVGTRMMLPEVVHGVIPDSGGTARLFQMAGHGVAADMALTGRVMTAEEALAHGVVSRLVADEEELDAVTLAMAETIAAAPAFTVKMARRTISYLATDEVSRSIGEEALEQSMVFASEDYAEMKAARAAERVPHYRRR